MIKANGWKVYVKEAKRLLHLKPNFMKFEKRSNNYSDKVIIKNCRTLKRELKVDIIYILREENRVADTMTKISVNQDEKTLQY